MHFEFDRSNSEISKRWCRGSHLVEVLVIALLIYMSRERGRPRKGAAWYAFVAHWKRHHRFERAFSMARTQRIHRTRKSRSPLVAYVEDVSLEEPIQVPPEYLLFTVPDN
jgi:hypothetical protein